MSGYELGHRTPSIATLERLLLVMGLSLTVARPTPVEERKARALHEAVVADAPGPARDVLDEWTRLLGGPVEQIVLVLLGTDPRSEHLASSNPFAGLLSPRERWDVLRRFRAEDGRP